MLFSEPFTETEDIPAPQLFLDMIQRQWESPGTYPNLSSYDRMFYNMTPDLTELLEIPEVDEPVIALASPSAAMAKVDEAEVRVLTL